MTKVKRNGLSEMIRDTQIVRAICKTSKEYNQMNKKIISQDSLIEIKHDTAFADSLQIAKNFGKQHKHVIQSIEKLLKTDEKIGQNLVQSFYLDSYNRKQKKYLLSKDAFVFVVQKYNTLEAHRWQWKYIEAFNKMESILIEKKSTDWQLTRENGKIIRRSETDAIAQFILYAEKQNSKSANKYYIHFSNLVNKTLDIKKGERDYLTPAMLSHVATFEDQVSSQLLKLMNNEKYYKDIYKDIKNKITLLSEMMILPARKYLPSEKRGAIEFQQAA